MSEPKTSGFIPKWFRDNPFDESDDVPVAFGTIPDQAPRLVSRLVPHDHGSGLPARFVSEFVNLKQDLILHAARDVAEGVNPDIAELSALPKSLRESVELIIDPIESGSFVIPAHLPASTDFQKSQTILDRFTKIFAALDDRNLELTLNRGILEKCKKLFELLSSKLDSIEFTPFDSENAPLTTVTLDRKSILKFREIQNRRQVTPTETIEELTGRLESIDLAKNEFHLKVDNHTRRVKGTPHLFSISSLKEFLGETVTLRGVIVREQKSVTITAHGIVQLQE